VPSLCRKLDGPTPTQSFLLASCSRLLDFFPRPRRLVFPELERRDLLTQRFLKFFS